MPVNGCKDVLFLVPGCQRCYILQLIVGFIVSRIKREEKKIGRFICKLYTCIKIIRAVFETIGCINKKLSFKLFAVVSMEPGTPLNIPRSSHHWSASQEAVI